MRPDEAAGVARLVGLALKGTSTLVYDVQAVASERVFDALAVAGGPLVSPVRVVHELSTAGVYAAVRGGL
ncbi:MAG TPA: hypothetical protein VHM65_09525, partial [Candidatus Lustribacter sp.]|nr:hypothetical protein [Candidatus Lustribacter sp.]